MGWQSDLPHFSWQRSSCCQPGLARPDKSVVSLQCRGLLHTKHVFSDASVFDLWLVVLMQALMDIHLSRAGGFFCRHDCLQQGSTEVHMTDMVLLMHIVELMATAHAPFEPVN
jgi:hypothetical protein